MTKKPVTFKLQGARELEKALLQMAKEFGPKNARGALNAPLKAAIKPVTSQINQDTPVETGELKSSVKTKLGRGPLLKSTKAQGGGKKSDIAQAVSTGWYDVSWYKIINVEYGNRSQEPARVISKALEDNAATVLSIFSNQWKAALKKSHERLAKKRGLGKLKIK